MTTPQYDPKGLEAAVSAVVGEGYSGDALPGARQIALRAITAYHEAIEPAAIQVECIDGEWYLEGMAKSLHLTLTGRVRKLCPGPTEEPSDG